MYKRASCTCKVGVLLIKPIVFWRSRCRPRRWILKSWSIIDISNSLPINGEMYIYWVFERDTHKPQHLGRDLCSRYRFFYKTFPAKNILEACYCCWARMKAWERAARVKVASADRNLTTSQFYQIIQIWSNLKIYFSCIHNNKKEGSPFSFHRHHRRPRRSVCQYINIHMDKLMRWVVETPMN